jgi:hypothetical protein
MRMVAAHMITGLRNTRRNEAEAIYFRVELAEDFGCDLKSCYGSHNLGDARTLDLAVIVMDQRQQTLTS